MELTKAVLSEQEMPTRWYNIAADMPYGPPPVIHPMTKEPVGPQDLAPLFAMELIKQEVSTEKWIDIPEELQQILKIWRPSPLVRARRLEKALDTPARIYYKWEGVSPAGSHKPNTAVAQCYFNAKEGIRRITTETGAGQWGSALSFAGSFFDVEIKVYMVRVSYDQKPYRRMLMQTWGGTCIPSPSEQTEAGRRILAEHPDSPGSLGLAISEAVEEAMSRDDTHYSLGSVLNHVILHQTIVGLETKKQLEMFNDKADILIGCHGGGSNFAGFSFPFLGDNFTKGEKYRIIAAEPASCPTLTRGKYAFDYGDVAGMTPIMKMHSLGHDFIPPTIHAGGLRYHGAAPLVSLFVNHEDIEARALHQITCFDAAVQFARTEGHVPAPESSHAVRAAIDEALACKESGESKAIVFNLSGHGHFDLSSYEKYFQGDLEDYAYPAAEIEAALARLPEVNVPV
ncbi:MAG: TrpB-like pyridoxal phosphate-dependent enzyme [Spirochaetota bacterium]